MGAGRVYPAMAAHELSEQRSSARLSAHSDSMTYAHTVPRARACAVSVACLLQKPCCFLGFYKNKPHPLRNKLTRHNRIIHTSTLLPKNNSSTETTDPAINMPTYIVSLNDLRLHRSRPCLEITCCV